MPKRRIEPIVGSRVRLRLLEETDLPTTLAWRNQDHIRKWFLHPDVIQPQEHRAWFDRYIERDDDFVFIIEDCRTTHRPVGQVALYDIDWDEQFAKYGRLLIGEPDARGQGLAHEATKLLVDYAFAGLRLTQVELEVFGDNLPALAIYRACGFREVGGCCNVVKMICGVE